MQREILDKYLTNHYSYCEKNDFNNQTKTIALLEKNYKVINLNLCKFFKHHVNTNKSILDLGCGYGNFLYFLQKHNYKNVTGIDLSSEEIKLCKKIFQTYKFYKNDILRYVKITKKKYDLIYLSHTLEHIKKSDTVTFLNNTKKILKKNGKLIIIVPNAGAYFNFPANRYGDITHKNGFTDLSLRQTLLLAKFKTIKIKNYYGLANANILLKLLRNTALFFFNSFIQILGYDRQKIYTPSFIAIVKK